MRKLLAAALCLAAAATGCGATVESSDDGRSTSVTLTNCGRKVTYDKVPERVVTNDVGITELMFALGLEDRMAGFAMPDDKGDLTGVPWKDGYDKVTWLSKDQLTKENVLDAKGDFVFAGWNYGFRDDNGFTPDALKKLGIPSYVLTESCRNGRTQTSRGIMPPLEALYADLTNLGKLFGVEKRAATLIAGFRSRSPPSQRRHSRRSPRSSSTTAARTSPSPQAAGPPPTRSSARPAGSTSCTTWTIRGPRPAGRASSSGTPTSSSSATTAT